MHDPLTLAFRIGKFIDIWHVDPLNFKNKICRRDDDSCGWFVPPYTPEQKIRIEKLSDEQFREIFSKLVAIREEKSYAYICNQPDVLGAVYWSWRAIKHLYKPKGVWQWGCRITASEWEHIYSLATCPLDNLEVLFSQITDEGTFRSFFFCVFGAYLRHSRPWYKHPRWHFWHWKINIHAINQFKRWAFSRCSTCGKKFSWGYSPVTNSWDGTGPLWFRKEKDVHHCECTRMQAAAE